MKFDLTRDSFAPLKHFSRVLSQQGRVQLDSDWNEQIDILTTALRALAADIIGPHGSPDEGFTIKDLDASSPVTGDVRILPGHYYVDGILCELEDPQVAVTGFNPANGKKITVAAWTVAGAPFQTGQYVALMDSSAPQKTVVATITDVDYAGLGLILDTDVGGLAANQPVTLHRLTTYLTQPDMPSAPALPTGFSQFYLDVWERLVTWVEDDSIREVALNGPDTTARARIVWQVKATKGQRSGCLAAQDLERLFQPANRGLLRARARPNPANINPCTVSPDSSYTGPENQCYRVEVHVGSNDPDQRPPSFKWSRENGSVVFPVVTLKTGGGLTTVVVQDLGRDDRFGLTEGDIVEVHDDVLALAGLSGPLLTVQAIDTSSLTVTLAGDVTDKTGSDPTLHPLLRRWDQKNQADEPLGADNAVAIALSGDPWLTLEDGVEVQFVSGGSPTYRTGDYWLIPARVTTGDVIWPTETVTDAHNIATTNPVAMPPDGITHHYAPLAVASLDGKAAPAIKPLCRRSFKPLTATT
jgi:hypothetical protein